jgi:uncharacterized pyridoxamine 5'-phosphate oxidase family protein
MEEVYKFLKDSNVFYLSTIEGDQPRVRPFGAVTLFGGKLYICTNKQKKVFKQMKENNKVEICSMESKGGWLRVEAEAIQDSGIEAKEAMLEEYPILKNMYSVDDDIYEVLYLKNATASFNSFGSEERIVKFGEE